MAKQKKSILDKNTNDLTDILNDLNERLIHLENFVVMQSKLLNTNILRSAAIIEILEEKGMITVEEIDKKSEEILKDVKEKAKELNKSDIDSVDLINALNSDDVGHA